jgi:hypothetical protein
MKNNIIRIHQPSRPLEYVAFSSIRFDSREGPVSMYYAVDAYSEFLFITGVETVFDSDTYLKHLELLMFDETFVIHKLNGFTLVLDPIEEIKEEITDIIAPHRGRLMFNADFKKEIIAPVLSHFKEKIAAMLKE